MKAGDILTTAASLVGGSRQEAHGDAKQCHDNIAALWNSYLSIRNEPGAPLTATDVVHLMCLLKLARTQAGSFNADNYVDLAGYAGVAGELAGD